MGKEGKRTKDPGSESVTFMMGRGWGKGYPKRTGGQTPALWENRVLRKSSFTDRWGALDKVGAMVPGDSL